MTTSTIRIVRITAMTTALVALVTIIVAILCGAAGASTPGVIGVGSRIVLIGGFGSCNVADFDEAADTFETAGHCGNRGDRFADSAGNYVGTVVSSVTHSTGVGDGEADVAIVKMAPGTIIRNEAPVTGAIAAPRVGDTVYKWGHGMGNQVVRFGEIVSVSEKGFVIKKMAVIFFDSGSPIIDSRGNIVGILSGSPDAQSALVSGAHALNLPVPPGTPDAYSIATRADYN